MTWDAKLASLNGRARDQIMIEKSRSKDREIKIKSVILLTGSAYLQVQYSDKRKGDILREYERGYRVSELI